MHSLATSMRVNATWHKRGDHPPLLLHRPASIKKAERRRFPWESSRAGNPNPKTTDQLSKLRAQTAETILDLPCMQWLLEYTYLCCGPEGWQRAVGPLQPPFTKKGVPHVLKHVSRSMPCCEDLSRQAPSLAAWPLGGGQTSWRCGLRSHGSRLQHEAAGRTTVSVVNGVMGFPPEVVTDLRRRLAAVS